MNYRYDSIPRHEDDDAVQGDLLNGAVRLRVACPEGLSQEYVLALCSRAVREGLRDIQFYVKQSDRWQAILESDAAFTELAGKLPIVRASTYGNKIGGRQELGNMASVLGWNDKCPENGHRHRDEPRRPVAMRGAQSVMIAKYSHGAPHIANGLAYKVGKRYLRRIKYSCDNFQSNRENLETLNDRLSEKFNVSHSFDFRCEYEVGPHVSRIWEDGEYVHGIEEGYWKLRDHPIRQSPPARQTFQRTVRKALKPKPVDRKQTIITRRREERAILRAVYDLGLIKQGELR